MASAFALNHRVAPHRSLESFFELAEALGVAMVEIRNDLADSHSGASASPEAVGAAAEARGLHILSINALQRFNDWTPERREQATVLADQARRAGVEALVLCPVNEEGWRPTAGERRAALVEALSGLAPILEGAGLLGLVEPLGFAECSLRLKRDAADAIDRIGKADRFKLVHDTFHHFVAGETELFPERTGLVHISGVEDRAVSRERMRDPHRVLVGAADLIDNAGQLRALAAGGYRGPVSFEPFAAAVAASADIASELRASMDFLAAELRAEAA